MAGTKEGYRKWRDNMIRKLGSERAFNEWRAKNGAKGGRNANPNNPSNFRNNRELARRAGKTKRTNVDQPAGVHAGQYKNERTEELDVYDKRFKMGREIAQTTKGGQDVKPN